MTESIDAAPSIIGPSPLDAVPEMRATAKWIAVAAAGVGSLLLGAGPLVAIGSVRGGGQVVGAVLGLAIALAGVGLAISFTAEALTPRVTTLATLSAPELSDLREVIDREPAAFFGGFGRTVDDLRAGAGLHARVAANLATALARETDPDRRQVLEQALADAGANTELARQLLRRLLEFAHAWQVRHALRRARRATMAAVAIVAAGAVVFLLSTGTPGTGKPAPPPKAATGTAATGTATPPKAATGTAMPAPTAEAPASRGGQPLIPVISTPRTM